MRRRGTEDFGGAGGWRKVAGPVWRRTRSCRQRRLVRIAGRQPTPVGRVVMVAGLQTGTSVAGGRRRIGEGVWRCFTAVMATTVKVRRGQISAGRKRADMAVERQQQNQQQDDQYAAGSVGEAALRCWTQCLISREIRMLGIAFEKRGSSDYCRLRTARSRLPHGFVRIISFISALTILHLQIPRSFFI